MTQEAKEPPRAIGALDYSIENYPALGCASLGPMIDPTACAHLRAWIDERRPISKEIFYATEAEFKAQGRWTNYAPGRTSHNLLLDPSLDLSFIENNPTFKNAMQRLCGNNYEIFKKSIIRSMPRWAVPAWLLDYVMDVGRPNMNPFVKDARQDVQYFLFTDFHQDKTRPASDFVTVYIYLDEVDPKYSALQILAGSHKLGMTVYPHSVRRSMRTPNSWFYSDGIGNHMECPMMTVTGGPGSISIFHCMTLHGTGFNDSQNPRISLRYLIKKGDNVTSKSLHDLANDQIIGPKSLLHTRLDVGIESGFQRTGCSLMSYGGN